VAILTLDRLIVWCLWGLVWWAFLIWMALLAAKAFA
jgi:hypothetical protein